MVRSFANSWSLRNASNGSYIFTMQRKLRHYLRMERRRAGLTQSDVADLLGVRLKSIISRFESGGAPPSLRTALAYEAVLGKPVADLFGGIFDEVRADVRRRARQAGRRGFSSMAPRQLQRKRSIERIAAR